jgi:hypothetical protein
VSCAAWWCRGVYVQEGAAASHRKHKPFACQKCMNRGRSVGRSEWRLTVGWGRGRWDGPQGEVPGVLQHRQ